MTQTDPVLIGVDIGTSSVKAVMVGADGTQLDHFAASHPMLRPVSGAAEQNPNDWMRSVGRALDQFSRHRLASAVQAIGVTSQVNTHLFCDANLQPLHTAITWQDTRPGGAASDLEVAISAAEKTRALGAPIPIDASHALARMAWMARLRPDVWAATAHVLLPKDYVIAHLTGEVCADPLSSIGLAGADHSYAQAMLALVPRAASVLAPLRDPLELAGRVRDGLAFAGVPVAVGTMDAWAGMFGLGVARDGQAMYLSGTSEVLGLIAPTRTGAAGVVTFPPWQAITLHAAPTQAGGASLVWLSRLLGQDVAVLSDMAGRSPIRADGPLFLPHLEGERAPLWDPISRGGFAGLSSTSGPQALAASVMEGVAFSARLALEAVEQSADQKITALRHGGGGASSDVWCQIRANALGRVLERVGMPDVGASGAVAMASVASGLHDDLGRATQRLTSVERVFEPEAAAAAVAEERFEAYQALYHRLSPIAAKLAEAAAKH